MRYPPDFIDRLRSHFRLSEVVGARVAIRKHGREHMGLCPFHSEKSPSFTVSDEKGFYHCFGCAAHGDVFSFLMQFDRLSYPEAVEKLARDAGIAVPQATPQERERSERQRTLHDVMDAACAWFEAQLAAAVGSSARAYLKQRGLRLETLQLFRLGYAPDTRDALKRHLHGQGISEPLAIEAGLLVNPGEGQSYDRFRGRVMFPIRNASGKIVAFGGRLLAAASANAQKPLPKYLNSPETALFKKGELLYNFDLARKAGRDNAPLVVMEGYMDVISCHQAGIEGCVATLGTAVTPEHLRLLWQATDEPVMCLDGDAAGRRAMLRAAEMALPVLKAGHNLRFMTLPAGDDPDNLVQKEGKQGFASLLESAKNLSEALWEAIAPAYNLALPESRAGLENRLSKLALTIQDASVQAHFRRYFRDRLWRVSSGKMAETEHARSAQVELMARGEAPKHLETLARQCFGLILLQPLLLHRSEVEEALMHLEMPHPALDTLRGACLDAMTADSHASSESLLAALDACGAGDTARAIMENAALPPSAGSFQAALDMWQDTIAAYRIALTEDELRTLALHLASAPDEALLARMAELQRQLKDARSRQFAVADEMADAEIV